MKQADFDDLFSAPAEAKKEIGPIRPAGSTASEKARKPESITQLTRRLRLLIEGSFSAVWVEGEISNLRAHPSGHVYFTLKDAQAQIPAVMFRGASQRLPFRPADGLKVIVSGSVKLYEPQGKYQIVCDTMEPGGIGALQLAFEQLKRTLAEEGLFDAARKKPLPLLPRTIGVVTSPSGAALRDILHVIYRRFPAMHVVLVPVPVQGEGAAARIARALDLCNQINRRHAADPARHGLWFDVLIVGRGGGSIEDLWAFNEEPVARAIARSAIPVISAVGHETDFTIADFVADLRAPTPSAAAELAVQPRATFLTRIAESRRRAGAALDRVMAGYHRRLDRVVTHYALREPQRLVIEHSQRLDELAGAARTLMHARLQDSGARLGAALQVLRAARTLFLRQIAQHARVAGLQRAALEAALEHSLARKRDALMRRLAQVEALGPAAVLRRGYTITRRADTGAPLSSAAAAAPGDLLRTHFSDGVVESTVTAPAAHAAR